LKSVTGISTKCWPNARLNGAGNAWTSMPKHRVRDAAFIGLVPSKSPTERRTPVASDRAFQRKPLRDNLLIPSESDWISMGWDAHTYVEDYPFPDGSQ